MAGNWVTQHMKAMAAQWISEQKERDGDYYDNGDILICGTCGEARQEWREFPNPTDEDPNGKEKILTTRMCKCDRHAEEERKRREQLERDMKRIRYLKSISLMDARYEEATFENFQKNEFNGRNFKMCSRYATAFDKMVEKNQGLILWGNVGRGKSYAAACIANHLLQKKVPVVMTSFVKILELIQKKRDAESNIISLLENAKLAIFDDFGAERSTDYAIEKVYNIIDSRYRSNLPMIFTTNLTIEEMKSEEDVRYARIYDRVFEVCYPIQFTGQSFRRIKASDRFAEMKHFLESED